MGVVLKCSGELGFEDGSAIRCSKIVLMDSGLALWHRIQQGPTPSNLEVGYPRGIQVREVEWSVMDDDPSTQAPPACDKCNDDPTTQPTGVCPRCFAGHKGSR
jgi:hypothetical protein